MQPILARLLQFPFRRANNGQAVKKRSEQMSGAEGFRNYRLAGNLNAKEFRHEDWYVCPIPRKRMKELMRRSDGKALLDFGLWMLLLAASAAVAWASWGTWAAVPAFALYGVLYGSGAESRFHECIHGTPFKTRRINEFFLVVLGFMSLKNPYLWRWSHTRHHTDTVIVGRDPEIAYPRPPDVWGMLLNVLHLRAGLNGLAWSVRQCFGRFTEDEKEYVPEDERQRVVLHARIHIGILLGAAAWSVAAGTVLPLLFIGLPTFYGSWVHSALSAMQHAGLAEDIPDHRLNSRTVYLNPVLRFIYANMNYHVEHHMFPMVPYYRLPELHEEMKHDCPPAYRGVVGAYSEMIPALRRQLKDPWHFVERELPEGAGRSAFEAVPAAA